MYGTVSELLLINAFVILRNLKEGPLRALLLKLTHIGRFAQMFPTFPNHILNLDFLIKMHPELGAWLQIQKSF